MVSGGLYVRGREEMALQAYRGIERATVLVLNKISIAIQGGSGLAFRRRIALTLMGWLG
jgi:hypothetical protein